MKVVTWETECGFSLEIEVPVRTFIFAMNRERAAYVCRREGLRPHSNDVSIISSEQSCRGQRVCEDDDVIVEAGFWERRDAWMIWESFCWAGANIRHVPLWEDPSG